MENTRLLVDVLLLPECNIYERYPELVQRVDYFLYNWTEEMLARTEALLRRQARALQSCPDDAFTHARSVNIAWRQFAVGRLGLPPYPPERINWNKDADPVFLYGQMPALRTHVPWSSHALRILRTPHRPADPQLKPVLKHTDLQTFLTSPTLSPLSSPSFSPVASPALSIRACTSSSSLSSANTLDADPPATLRPRLRFNDHVEQCMVVFDQEKEYLPTDAEDASDDDARRLRSASRRKPRARRSLVIRLASAHLKGDHRKVLSVSAASPRGPGHYFNSDDEDDYDDEDPFADLPLYRSAAADSSSSSSRCPPSEDAHKQASRRGVSGYVQGCVESVAGQVRKLVSSTYAARPSPSAEVVADPYAASLATPVRSQQQQLYRQQQQPLPADVVRDPFASSSLRSTPAHCSPSHNTPAAPLPAAASPDHVPFDDEDSIIQQFEREMLKYSNSSRSETSSSSAYLMSQPYAAEASLRRKQHGQQRYDSVMDDQWGASEFDMYCDAASDDEFDYYADQYSLPNSSSLISPASFSADNAPPHHQQQPVRTRNESLIDRAEDTIFNTVDAVKWCASFISNYTVF